MCANAKHKRGSEETQSAINLRRNGYYFYKGMLLFRVSVFYPFCLN